MRNPQAGVSQKGFKVTAIMTSLFVLLVLALIFLPSVLNTPIRTIATRLNRFGLIFQFVGVFSVFPELLRRNDTKKWEMWFRNWGRNVEGENLSLRKFFMEMKISDFVDEKGALGLMNRLSKVCMLLVIGWGLYKDIRTNSFPVESIFIYCVIMGLLFLFLINYLISGLENKGLVLFLRFIYKFFNLLTSLWCSLFFFLPLSFIVFPVFYSLRGLSQEPLEKVFIKITFPFVLGGIFLQFVASFWM